MGFDCSGFVKYVYKSINVELPHNSHLMSELEGTVIPLEEAEPGDLIFFGSRNGKKWRTQHAGIIYEYTEEEPRVIHCVSRGVSIDGNNTSWDSYWKDRILFVKRLPQLD
jgi:cell wall-associated NlpC family hydrolase